MSDKFILSSVSFFCPAYNDAGNLPNLIPNVHKFLTENSRQFEIVIIDDGGLDKTGEVSEELARQFSNTQVVHHRKNMGYTATLKEGFEMGKYDYIMYTDGDNQYDIYDFRPYLYLLEENHIISGYAIKKAVSNTRKLQSIVHNILISILFFSNFKDINCSMKIIKKEVIDEIKINSNPYGAFIDAELILKAKKMGFKVAQFPVTHYARMSGVASGSKPSLIFNTIKDMIKLRLNLI